MAQPSQEPLELPSFQEWLTSWGPVGDANKASIGDGWGLATLAFQLHRDALETIRLDESITSEQRRAIVLLGTHMIRILTIGFGAVSRGFFDVAPYLMRGLYDTQSLLLGCVQDRDFAEKVLVSREQNLAAEARKGLVAWFRATGLPEVAAEVDSRFMKDRDAGNTSSHVNAFHVVRVLAPSGTEAEEWIPVFAGFEHSIEARTQWAAFLEIETWALLWFSLCSNGGSMTAEWKRRHKEFDAHEGEYRAVTSDLIQKTAPGREVSEAGG